MGRNTTFVCICILRLHMNVTAFTFAFASLMARSAWARHMKPTKPKPRALPVGPAQFLSQEARQRHEGRPAKYLSTTLSVRELTVGVARHRELPHKASGRQQLPQICLLHLCPNQTFTQLIHSMEMSMCPLVQLAGRPCYVLGIRCSNFANLQPGGRQTWSG